ncbi:MAG: DNA polymerase domain-containing protein, partial [Nitrososphaerales archaeon]
REQVSDYEGREILKLNLKQADDAQKLAKIVEKSARFGHYRIYNSDLLPAQTYFIEKDLFPLAFVSAKKVGDTIIWKLLDSIESEDYKIPPLRKATLRVKVDSRRVIPKFTDPIKKIVIFSEGSTVEIDSGDEKNKISSLTDRIKELDPDLLFIEDGDNFTTHYLAERAYVNGILDKLILSRDQTSLRRLESRGTSYVAYGRVLHTPTSHILHGRINLDAENYFVFEECGLEGLFEVARICRIPLHKGSRASIGRCLSSMQFAIAQKENLLVPWKPTRAEVPKTARELLIGDRGGFIFEPRIGVHEKVGEIDFTSLYPFIMRKYNISAETIRCKCCHDSKLRVPDVDYNICQKREGIIPQSLKLILEKRISYKRKKNQSDNALLKKSFGAKVDALKGILVCSFGYLSYRNAKFGLIDCHIAVCAYARKILLETARIAERRGFEIVHGIVDSLWVKKPNAEKKDFLDLCKEIEEEIGLPLSFEGTYKWIAFLQSRMHDDVPVLNRYFGIFEDGSMKVRGIELRRRDSIKLVTDCQREILELLSFGNSVGDVKRIIPEALILLKSYVQIIRDGRVPLTDLVITNRLSKNHSEYTSMTSQASAVKQLADEGLELMAGQSISYVITKFKSRLPKEKVRPIELLDSSVSYDKDRYIKLLVRGASAILQPFGLDEELLLDHVTHENQQSLLFYTDMAISKLSYS